MRFVAHLRKAILVFSPNSQVRDSGFLYSVALVKSLPVAKDTFYFSHDYGARNDPKLQKVLLVLGHEGKSVFWDIIEMLYENGGSLRLDECGSYAFALRTTEEIIKRLVKDFDLFENDAVNFWSRSVNDRLKQRKKKSDTAKKSANKRWKTNKLGVDANAMQTHSERNAINNNKVKDNSLININIQAEPENVEEVIRFFEEYHRLEPEKASKEGYKFWNHCRARNFTNGTGQKIENWKAYAANWKIK